MSAPDTDIDKQKKQHSGPLLGILGGVAFVAVLLIVYLVTIAGPGDELPGATAAPAEVTAPADSN